MDIYPLYIYSHRMIHWLKGYDPEEIWNDPTLYRWSWRMAVSLDKISRKWAYWSKMVIRLCVFPPDDPLTERLWPWRDLKWPNNTSMIMANGRLLGSDISSMGLLTLNDHTFIVFPQDTCWLNDCDPHEIWSDRTIPRWSWRMAVSLNQLSRKWAYWP